MNTQYIYICNIPSNFKPVLLLHELKNKWARMLYLENSFSGLRDAFVYNPTDNFPHFCNGVQRLRDKVIDGEKPLSVHFVWFPPSNMCVTTMIPEGSSMLSYLFVENLHKDVILSEIIYDLPLNFGDIKNWDIQERPDKCLIIKLPSTSSPAMISFVIGTLRQRVNRGLGVRVSELIISEQPQLNNQLIPRSLKIHGTRIESSYLSNFYYLHEIPSNLTVKMLIEAAKSEKIRGVQVFFLETKNNMKYGFMYVPRSLPSARFQAMFERLRVEQFTISEDEVGHVRINMAWFQPEGAEPPRAAGDGGEMVLTEYLYLSMIPPGVTALQLSLGCPWPIKLYVFLVNEITTQIGFVVLRGIGSRESHSVVAHLRALDLGGARLQVNEVHIACEHLPDKEADRPFQLRPRASLPTKDVLKRPPSPLPLDTANQIDVVVPAISNGLTRTDFICVDRLPRNLSKAALVFDVGRASDGCVLIPGPQHSIAFIYFPECDIDSWRRLLLKLSTKSFGGRHCDVHEVYLKSDFTDELETPDFLDSDVIFVYNIASAVENHEVCDLYPTQIKYCEILETTSGSKSAFVILREGATVHKAAFLHNLRKQFLHGKPVYADLLKLAPIKLSSNTEIKKPRHD